MIPYDPPAYVQSEHVHNEPKAYYPELRDDFWSLVVPGEREAITKRAVERQVERFNATVGLFAAVLLARGAP